MLHPIIEQTDLSLIVKTPFLVYNVQRFFIFHPLIYKKESSNDKTFSRYKNREKSLDSIRW